MRNGGDTTKTLQNACASFLSLLNSGAIDGEGDVALSAEIAPFDDGEVLTAVRGIERVAFKSRDRDFLLVGIGAADLITDQANRGLPTKLQERASSLKEGQLYFSAQRFDVHAPISSEWRTFGAGLSLLPLLCLVRKNGRFYAHLNYRRCGHLPLACWLDRAKSILLSLLDQRDLMPPPSIACGELEPPKKANYLQLIEKALSAIGANPPYRKVVLGRKRVIALKQPCDPVEFFLELKKRSANSHLFFLDKGEGSAFLGASPELLYRREGRELKTESLAGTRRRSDDPDEDVLLREDLISSAKDNLEHLLVCSYIENKLQLLSRESISSSKTEVMALSYVQHLLRRYRAHIDDQITDEIILSTLSPTPAVCGMDFRWARQFIRENEGFDRGFYAGPIGYIGKDVAEFAVGIRSALFHEQRLYVYAASGIVADSNPEDEWEELNNKEKNILKIFDQLNLSYE